MKAQFKYKNYTYERNPMGLKTYQWCKDYLNILKIWFQSEFFPMNSVSKQYRLKNMKTIIQFLFTIDLTICL